MKQIILIICLACNIALARQCGYPSSIYVNGILTSRESAYDATHKIEQELQKTIPNYKVELAYNQTNGGFLDLVESLYQKAQTYHLRTADASVLIYGVVSSTDTGLRDSPSGFMNDAIALLGSAIVAIQAEFSTTKSIYNTTLTQITDILRAALASSSGLYLIGHSQGSLFVNDALYLLDQNELNASSGRRPYSGTYFVGPAASSQFASYGRGYTKFNEDILNQFGIGLVGNASLFESLAEQTADASEGDPLNHGMLDAYFMADGPAPYERSYQRVAQHLVSDVQSLKAPCNYVESTETINSQTITIISDPLLANDYNYCESVASLMGASFPASRQACLSSYLGSTVAPISGGQALPLNFVGVCNLTDQTVKCTKIYSNTSGNLTRSTDATFVGTLSSRDFSCATDQFMYVNQTTNQSNCYAWSELTGALPH